MTNNKRQRHTHTSAEKSHGNAAHASAVPQDEDGESSERLGVGFWLLTCALAAAAGVGGYWIFSKLHDFDTGYSQLDPFARRLQLYSEQAFYYSFYEDLVKSPSVVEGIYELFNETRSEYPLQINAIERFNIYPEVVTAIVYRQLGSKAPADPLDFMVFVLMALTGLQWAGFFVCVSYLGRSPFCGIVACLFIFIFTGQCSRINMHLTLRENFATPFLWWQIFFLLLTLRQTRVHLGALTAFVLSTCAFMLCWQFAQFILLLQLAAVYAAYVTCSLARPLFLSVLKGYLLATILVIAVTVGNTMLLTSMHLLLCAALLLVVSLDKERLAFFPRLWHGFAAGLLMVLAKLLLGFIIDDDAHIFRILRAKLFNYEDFITFLYLCGPTYRAMPVEDMLAFGDSYLLQTAGVVLLLLVVTVVAALCRHSSTDPSFSFIAVQGVLFCLLAATVQRLAIVSTPHLALLAGLAASTSLLQRCVHAVTRHKIDLTGVGLVVVAVAAAVLLQTRRASIIIEDLQFAQPNPRVDHDTANLIKFLESNTSPDAVIAADSVLTSAIKLFLRRRVPFHPHTENQEVRQRHFQFFQVYNSVPEEEIYDMLKQWDADYVVLSDGPCNLQCPEGQTMAYMANTSDARGRSRRGRGRPDLSPFCKTVRTARLKRFEKIYDRGPFVVLRLKAPKKKNS